MEFIIIFLVIGFVLKALLPALVQSGFTIGGNKSKYRKEVEDAPVHGTAGFVEKKVARRGLGSN